MQGEEQWKCLNEIAGIYSGRGDYIVAFLCFLDSLRLKPDQEDVFELIESLKEHAEPRFPEKLRENKYTVSILTAAHSRTGELRESIKSALAQTFIDFELLILNDAGTDEIGTIAESFNDSRVKYYKFHQNRGLRATLNHGILRAQGKYIAYLDDDDVYYPNHLEKLVQALKSSNHRIAFTNTQGVKEKKGGGQFKKSEPCFLWNREYNRNRSFLTDNIATLCIMHEKALFDKVGLFFEDRVTSLDMEMWLRISAEYDCLHVNDVTSEYRIKRDNATVLNRPANHFLGHVIRNYHILGKGKAVYAKYYLHKGQRQKAYELYKEITSDLEHCFVTRLFVEEAGTLAKCFGERKLYKKLLKSYFRSSPRQCLKVISDNEIKNAWPSILPLVPAVGLRFLARKISNR